MANTTFVDKSTIISSSWLNEINNFFWVLFKGATTPAQAREALGIGSPSVIQENTTERTLVLSDSGKYIVTNNNSAVQINIPSGIFTAPTAITITQLGSGQVTVSGNVGVTVLSAVGTSTRAQYSTIGLLQVTPTIWILTGDLA